jgi:small conductance mechanosensitive channel
MDFAALQAFVSATLLTLAIKVLAAIAFWLVGRWAIRRVVDLTRAAMGRAHLDPTLAKYLGAILGVLLNVALALGILGYFGVQTTSFAALLAGAGVAIGAAWSG